MSKNFYLYGFDPRVMKIRGIDRMMSYSKDNAEINTGLGRQARRWREMLRQKFDCATRNIPIADEKGLVTNPSGLFRNSGNPETAIYTTLMGNLVIEKDKNDDSEEGHTPQYVKEFIEDVNASMGTSMNYVLVEIPKETMSWAPSAKIDRIFLFKNISSAVTEDQFQQDENIIKTWCEEEDIVPPKIYVFQSDTALTPESERFNNIKDGSIIIGGQWVDAGPEAERYSDSIFDNKTIPDIFVNEHARYEELFTGFRRVQIEGKTLYWKPGHVVHNPALIIGIVQTIALINGQSVEKSAGIDFQVIYNSKPFESTNMLSMLRNIRGEEDNSRSRLRSLTRNISENQRHIEGTQKQREDAWKKLQIARRSTDVIPLDEAREDIQFFLHYPQIRKFDFIDGRLIFETTPIIAYPNKNSYNGKRFEPIWLGSFLIGISTRADDIEQGVRSFREGPILIRNIDQMDCTIGSLGPMDNANGPHMRHHPCWGNIESSVRNLYHKRDYKSLILMILQYLGSYNVEDQWGQTADYWPRLSAVKAMWAKARDRENIPEELR